MRKPSLHPLRSLLGKELRSMRAFLVLVLFFAALNWAFLLLSEFPDQYPLSKLISPDARESGQVFMFIVAYALASGLIVRERDEGTLAFLDALPLSRARVFFAKVLLALGMLWLLPLSDLFFNLTFYALSRTSLDARFHWGIPATAALLDAAACGVYLSVGLALSFLRRFSLLVMGLLFWGYILLLELDLPWLGLLNPFSLGDPVFHGQRWLVPVEKLAVQLGLALACIGVAFAGFMAMGDATQRLAEGIKRRRGSGLIAPLAGVIIAGLWISLAVYFAEHDNEAETQTEVGYLPWSLSRAHTERYLFVYPENQAGLVGQFLDRADDAEARVRGFLGAKPISSIVANLTGAGSHAAGQARWKSVQIDLAAAGGNLADLLAVLGHETAHVYLDHLSAMRLSDQFNSTRFFHEGLASYVEHRLFRSPEELLALRRVAAATHARQEARIEELLDSDTLTARRDGDLVYPLGEIFVAALVRHCGETAPGRLARAFARPDVPQGLEGFALWRDAFQACGHNFDDVVDAFYAELDRAVAESRPFLDSLPRLRGAVETAPDRVGIRAAFTGEAPGLLLVRFRPDTDTDPRFYEARTASPGEVLWRETAEYGEQSFWYQLGWSVPGASQPIYEAWLEVRRAP